MDKDLWDKGKKISEPLLKFYAVEDFLLAQEQNYFENHQLKVEILHDPTFKGQAGDESQTPVGAGTGTGPNSNGGAEPTVEDLRLSLATILEIDVKEVDPSLTAEQLKAEIASAKEGMQ